MGDQVGEVGEVAGREEAGGVDGAHGPEGVELEALEARGGGEQAAEHAAGQGAGRALQEGDGGLDTGLVGLSQRQGPPGGLGQRLVQAGGLICMGLDGIEDLAHSVARQDPERQCQAQIVLAVAYSLRAEEAREVRGRWVGRVELRQGGQDQGDAHGRPRPKPLSRRGSPPRLRG